MKKSHFCGLKMFLFCLKHGETLFLRVFWENAKKKNVLEFFCPKSRVTPLKNCDFWHYEKIPFLWSKNVSVLFRRWRNSIFKGILRKSKKKKMFWNIFVQNRGLPLWKIAIFGLMKKSHFCGLKWFLFCVEHKETLFKRILRKSKYKFFGIFFDQNRGLTPLENCDVWPNEKWAFLWSKNVSFLFRTWRNSIFKIILAKNK